MPILYSVISRNATVLARNAICAGNFAEVTEQILDKINANEASRLTYSHASYLFHYVTENGVIYLCITDDEFERKRAFMFLEDIKAAFQTKYHDKIETALPYGMNSEFSKVLSTQMKHYAEVEDIDNVGKLQGEVADVKNILIKNIESLSSRGERLELLVNKTENLNSSAVTFRTSSRTLSRQLWWKNIRIYVYIVLGLAVSIYIIGAMACGVTWKSCTS
ncbi:Vesicle-associated membrane protein 7 [Armadillidium nasatum]|uniref:Vesicle-associated membrane protein 7 n=1 Tax=Armadillidium nasatum TaxID=96803 RepID=A0A5N5TFA7_9CRUS|nr:Vesicle-associated membrane protein 7 [Armadillidium nasatum]